MLAQRLLDSAQSGAYKPQNFRFTPSSYLLTRIDEEAPNSLAVVPAVHGFLPRRKIIYPRYSTRNETFKWTSIRRDLDMDAKVVGPGGEKTTGLGCMEESGGPDSR